MKMPQKGAIPSAVDDKNHLRQGASVTRTLHAGLGSRRGAITLRLDWLLSWGDPWKDERQETCGRQG